jgi:hypothetical protein
VIGRDTRDDCRAAERSGAVSRPSLLRRYGVVEIPPLVDFEMLGGNSKISRWLRSQPTGQSRSPLIASVLVGQHTSGGRQQPRRGVIRDSGQATPSNQEDHGEPDQQPLPRPVRPCRVADTAAGVRC